MTIKPILTVLMLFTWNLHAQESALTAHTIPWGIAQDKYIKNNDFTASASQDKSHIFESKMPTKINGVDFNKTVKFLDTKGLSQITHIANLKNEDVEKLCSNLQESITKMYGQRTNEVHVKNQEPNNYTQVIWTSKLDRTVDLFCYTSNNSNFVSVTLYPRWTVLDCTMHSEDPMDKKNQKKRAFFYFDAANEEIRFFNNSNVTLPFQSTFQSMRIQFSHNNDNDRSTIDLNTGVIMSKFIENKGKEQLLVGKCKIQ